MHKFFFCFNFSDMKAKMKEKKNIWKMINLWCETSDGQLKIKKISDLIKK